jgi:hypothetical protein
MTQGLGGRFPNRFLAAILLSRTDKMSIMSHHEYQLHWIVFWEVAAVAAVFF